MSIILSEVIPPSRPLLSLEVCFVGVHCGGTPSLTRKSRSFGLLEVLALRLYPHKFLMSAVIEPL